MRVLVTGGSGFIGTVLVGDLLREGHEVKIFDKRMSERFAGLCVLGDVRDAEALETAMAGGEAVVHLAAEHTDDVSPASLYYDVNVGGARNLAAAAERLNLRSIVFTSSVALYGLDAGQSTEESPVRPFNGYGKSKHAAEEVFFQWAEQDPVRSLTVVRPVVIFGPGNRGNVYNLMNQMASGRFFMVGNGRNRKSMGYVENISLFLIHCLGMAPGVRVFNYADKPDLSTRELVAIVREAMGLPEKTIRVPYFAALLGGHLFDLAARITGRKFPVSAIRVKKFHAETVVRADRIEETGFTPPYSLGHGIREMVKSEFPEKGLKN